VGEVSKCERGSSTKLELFEKWGPLIAASNCVSFPSCKSNLSKKKEDASMRLCQNEKEMCDGGGILSRLLSKSSGQQMLVCSPLKCYHKVQILENRSGC
jgi:hypothetical protein